MSEQKLNEIKELLEELKDLLVFINQEKIQEQKKKLIQKNSVEAIIYDLCDEENTISDMVEKSGKKNDNVKKVLSNLRQKGLIKTTKKDTKTVYKKQF